MAKLAEAVAQWSNDETHENDHRDGLLVADQEVRALDAVLPEPVVHDEAFADQLVVRVIKQR